MQIYRLIEKVKKIDLAPGRRHPQLRDCLEYPVTMGTEGRSPKFEVGGRPMLLSFSQYFEKYSSIFCEVTVIGCKKKDQQEFRVVKIESKVLVKKLRVNCCCILDKLGLQSTTKKGRQKFVGVK